MSGEKKDRWGKGKEFTFGLLARNSSRLVFPVGARNRFGKGMDVRVTMPCEAPRKWMTLRMTHHL